MPAQPEMLTLLDAVPYLLIRTSVPMVNGPHAVTGALVVGVVVGGVVVGAVVGALVGAVVVGIVVGVGLGVPAVAFTEHVDFTVWSAGDSEAGLGLPRRGHIEPLDVEGYLASIERCRVRYPDLRILTGIEAGEAHLFAGSLAAALVALGEFRRGGLVRALLKIREPRHVPHQPQISELLGRVQRVDGLRSS